MKIHVVQENESLWKIAQKYGVDFEELIAVNQQLSDPDMIMPGMKIKIPSTSNKQNQAPAPGKKQQTIPKKDKQEVVPVEPTQPKNQILPEIKEDEDKKWEPLKKELPSLPINFNKQQPAKKEQPMQQPMKKEQPKQPVMPQQEPSQDLKWLQFTSNMNNFETNIQPVQPKEDMHHHHHHPPAEKPQQQMPEPKYPTMPKPQVQPMQMQAPCYSQEGIPFGGEHMQPMHHMNPMGGYPFPENFQPNVMGTSQQQMPMSNQPFQSMQQPNMMPQSEFMPQPNMMPQSEFMPQQQPMQQSDFMAQQQPMQQPYMQQPMMNQEQPWGQQMPQQQMMNPQQLNVPQPGMPGYPMVPFPQQGFGQSPYGMQQPNMYHNPMHGPGMMSPYHHPKKNDCGCGNREE